MECNKVLMLKNISSGYNRKQVLFNINFSLNVNDYCLIMGANGSGKSTLLKVIYGLLKPWNDGEITFNGINISNKKPCQLKELGIVYIPQKDELFEELTVINNIKLAALVNVTEEQFKIRLAKILKLFPLLKDKMKISCAKLSGGERKIVTYAMAMISDPKLIIFDEPLASLDDNNIDDTIEHLKAIKAKGISMIFVEHNYEPIFNITNKRLLLCGGKLFDRPINNIKDVKEYIK
mgnify:CR=1 FL=1